jgi:hypothetical protein
MRGKQKGLNEEQADTLHHGLSESGRASKKSSQTSPIKKDSKSSGGGLRCPESGAQ